MPNNIIKSFAEKSNKSVEEVETLWDIAKQLTIKEYIKNDSEPTIDIILLLQEYLKNAKD